VGLIFRMNFTQFTSAAAQRAQNHQECTECFAPLCDHPVVCFIEGGKRSCTHFFHDHCIDRQVKPTCCPLCKKHYESVSVLPIAIENPVAWLRAVDFDGDGSLSYEEIIDGLKAQVKLDWNKIEADVDKHFSKWDKDKSGSISLQEFVDPVNGVIPYMRANFAPHVAIKPMPDITNDKHGWFNYWDEDSTGSLDKTEVCRALIKTLRQVDRQAIVSIIDCIWPMFDTDGSGSVDYNEFIAPDGLADTIRAQIAYM